VESKVLHRGKFLEFRIDTVERADGSRATRDIAGHPGAVAIVALDAEDRVALVRQWRLPANAALLEIPAGGLDVHDGIKEDPDVAARRELEEETGMRAATWQKLAEFYSAPGFTEELMHLYLATDLEPAAADGRLGPDEDERLILEWRPWRDAVAAVISGEIRDAKSVAGLLWLERIRRMEGAEGTAAGSGLPASTGARPASRSGDAVTVSYGLTQREVVGAAVSMARGSTGIRLLGLFVVVITSMAVLAGDLLSVLGLVVGVALVTGWAVAPFAWWQFRKRPDLIGATTNLTADASGIEIDSPLAQGHMAWSTFRRVRDAGGSLLFDTAAGSVMIVPKRAFSPSELGSVYRLLDRNGLLSGNEKR
jgi:ADP-ribose pyrophosphatase